VLPGFGELECSFLGRRLAQVDAVVLEQAIAGPVSSTIGKKKMRKGNKKQTKTPDRTHDTPSSSA
jgi:hypothetical protein